ncbi:hypothetical protein [Nonomuraea sp. NPDC048826]|uniref:hypothetical protein n=1 Tax=Nonomuraea sp. NPDC048826 TaxID=3364347 RepID=UPI003711AAF9
MSSPQHRVHLVDRVERLESCAFAISADIANLRTVVELLDYTAPVFGDIMAGRANLATREDLQKLEQRLTDKFEDRFSGVDARLDGIDSRLDSMDARFDTMDARFDRMDSRLDQILLAIGRTQSGASQN